MMVVEQTWNLVRELCFREGPYYYLYEVNESSLILEWLICRILYQLFSIFCLLFWWDMVCHFMMSGKNDSSPHQQAYMCICVISLIDCVIFIPVLILPFEDLCKRRCIVYQNSNITCKPPGPLVTMVTCFINHSTLKDVTYNYFVLFLKDVTLTILFWFDLKRKLEKTTTTKQY